MTENTTGEPKKKKSEKGLWLGVLAALLILGVVYFFSLDTPPSVPELAQTEEQIADKVDGEPADTTATSTVTATTDTAAASATGSVDLQKAMTERVFGDASAAIKITEHASLTCPHCARFHVSVFEEFKKNYIDTGKAYLVFSDFPLNAPALHATMISPSAAVRMAAIPSPPARGMISSSAPMPFATSPPICLC